MLVLFACLAAQAFAQGFLEAEFAEELGRRTGSSLAAGNRFEVLTEARATLARKLALIDGARSRIFISTLFLFAQGDRQSRELVATLEAKARGGVDVRIVVDSLAGLLDRPSLWRLERAGVRVAYFSLPDREVRNHAKILLVDDRQAVVGGSNMVDESFPFLPRTKISRWADTDVVVEGPVVADVRRGFARLWNRLVPERPLEAVPEGLPPDAIAAVAAGPVASGSCRFLYNEPGEGTKEINECYLLLFERARRRIVWQANFLDPSPEIGRALAAAAARGTEVVLLTNSLPGPYHRYLDWRRRDAFAGTAVQVRCFSGGFDHSKVLLVDDEVCSIGSYNHDWMSSENDSESTLLIHDPAVVEAVRARVDDAIRGSRPWGD